MTKPCVRCGKPFEAKRSTAKYCGSTCRSLESTDPGGGSVVDLPPSEPSPESTYAVTRAELEKHERLMTPQGMAALVIARKLDDGSDSGSAIAALAKQLASTMDLALAGVRVADDPLDELAVRRAHRAGA